MLPSAAAHVEETIRLLFSFIQAQGHTDYIGERVSQLQHSLQCAHLASQNNLYGHDHEVILGALLHDVGRFIPAAKDMPKMIAPDGTYVGRSSHEVLGERYLRQLGFSEKVSQLVGAHVIAKRYLTAVEPGYYEALSTTSKRTLQYQVKRKEKKRKRLLIHHGWMLTSSL
jgi:putative nucleotidyltransferase with HDIG domain